MKQDHMPSTPQRKPTIKVNLPRARRPVRSRRTGRDASNPLALWRTRGPERITPSEIACLAERVAATEIPHERRWDAARNGDAATAVAVAIDHLHRRRAMTQLTDVIIGNLVVLAKAGDATAPLVIGHALRTLGRIGTSGPDPRRLARLWGSRASRCTGASRRNRTS